MNTLYVDLEQEWRGGQNQALLTLRGLREMGHSAELVAVKGSALARRAEAEGVPAHLVERHARRLRTTLLLRRLLAQRKFDVLHVNEPHALTAAWLAGAHRMVPLIISRRVGYPLQENRISLGRYRAAQRIVANSQFVAKAVMASGLPTDRISVVHEGVELPPPLPPEQRTLARYRWGAAPQDKLLGCVGALLPDKGLEFVIRAAPILREAYPTCRLLLVGEGSGRAQFEDLARHLGVRDAVHFAGFVEDMPQVYAALDVFLFPALFDALPNSLLAAMAYALPVVAIARGGVPEIIEDELSGLLVPDSHPSAYPAAIANAAARVFSNHAWSQDLGRAARERIRKCFTSQVMVQGTLQVYGEVCGKM